MATEDAEKPEPQPGAVTTVAKSVLSVFFDELAKIENMADIAGGLRKVVLVDGVFTEPALRAALFPDAP